MNPANPRRLTQREVELGASRPIAVRVHQLFRRQRGDLKAEWALRATGIGLLVLAIALLWPASRAAVNAAGWMDYVPHILAIAASFGGAIACMGCSIRRYDRGFHNFMYENVGGDHVFLICLRCEYRLHGCEPPRERCPECGTRTARYVWHREGWHLELPEPESQQPAPETP
ncbi:MAG: hypothetical protein AAF078_06505 [Planctomycetota bacterium]